MSGSCGEGKETKVKNNGSITTRRLYTSLFLLCSSSASLIMDTPTFHVNHTFFCFSVVCFVFRVARVCVCVCVLLHKTCSDGGGSNTAGGFISLPPLLVFLSAGIKRHVFQIVKWHEVQCNKEEDCTF